MMAAGRTGELFRKKSLERLSSPERLDQLLQIADRKSWIPLATGGALVLGLVTWAVLGHVPVNVEGRGMLVRPHKVVAFQAPGGGRLLGLEVRVGDVVHRGQLLGRIERPELQARLRLKREKLLEVTAQAAAAENLRDQRTSLEEAASRIQGESLKDHIQRSEALAKRLYEERRAAITEEERRLTEQEQVARALVESLAERLDGQRELHEQGLVSRDALNDLEEDYVESLTRLYDVETDLRELRTESLRADEQYFDRLQRVSEWSFELRGLDVRDRELAQENLESATEYEQRIADTRREIEQLETELAEQSRIVANEGGRVLEINAVPGSILAPGERLGSMEVNDPDSPLTSLTYFAVKDGKRLKPGMTIRITPDTVERERYGSIVGEIKTVSDFPVSPEEIESVIGNRVVAESLVAGGFLMEVFADLMPSPTDPGRFLWSSSRGPDVDVSAGTTTSARAVVERRRPIAFVFPLLKSAAGVD